VKARGFILNRGDTWEKGGIAEKDKYAHKKEREKGGGKGKTGKERGVRMRIG
jgi:hypothetical protein